MLLEERESEREREIDNLTTYVMTESMRFDSISFRKSVAPEKENGLQNSWVTARRWIHPSRGIRA